MSDAGSRHRVGHRLHDALRRELESIMTRASEIGNDPSPAIHEIRKCSKRARALLRLARPGIGEDRYHAHNAEYRDIARLLGPARDAEVGLTTLEGVLSDLPELDREKSVKKLRKRLRKRRRKGWKAVAAPDGLGTQVERRSRAVLDTLGGLGLHRVGPAEAAGGLARVYRDGTVRWAAAREGGNARVFHRWRRRAKDLQYQLQFLAPDLPPRLADRIPAQKELGERLGSANDWTNLMALLEGDPGLLPDSECRARITTPTLERRNAAWAAAVELGESLYADEPATLKAEIRAALSDP